MAAEIGAAPSEILFADDNEGNVIRAASQGWDTIVFKDVGTFEPEIGKVLDEKA